MIKELHSGGLQTFLDIKTKDGKQIFRGHVTIHEGSYIDVDNAMVYIERDEINRRYICKVEVQ